MNAAIPATAFRAADRISAIGVSDIVRITQAANELKRQGQPVIVLHGALKDWFEARGLTAHLSVTDETDYAASFCVVEKIEAKLGSSA